MNAYMSVNICSLAVNHQEGLIPSQVVVETFVSPCIHQPFIKLSNHEQEP